MVSSSGGTIGTLNVPGLGIGVSATGQVTLYATTLPTFTPGTPGAGITASATVQDYPVWVSPILISTIPDCADGSTTAAGPVTYSHGDCETTITFTI
jgi:hypothetical protein